MLRPTGGATLGISRYFRTHMAQTKALKGFIGAAAVVLVLGGYRHFTHRPAVAVGQSRLAAPVRTAKIERRDMAVVEHTLGTVVANTMVRVTARVQGTIESVHFKEGQFVKKGDLLFQIDPRPFRIALAQARAILLRDEALLKNATRDKQRYDSLFSQNSISAQQRDTSHTNVAVLAATVAADKAAVNSAQLNLDYSEIRSPIDGKTGALLVQPGNMVAGTGATVLVTIAQIQPIKFAFNLPQSDLPLIQARQKVHPLIATIDMRDSQGHRRSAPVDFVDNAIANQSGTVELRANFPNTDHSLLPGQLLNVTVELDELHDALVVPRDGVNDGPDGSYVYVVVGGRAVQRRVKVLFDDSTNIAIDGDVHAGEEVIVEGQLRVVPDGAVVVMSPDGAHSGNDEAARANAGSAHNGGKAL